MTIKSIVTKSLICSAVALATVASASATMDLRTGQPGTRYRIGIACKEWTGAILAAASSQPTCMASASGTAAYCGINPAYGYHTSGNGY